MFALVDPDMLVNIKVHSDPAGRAKIVFILSPSYSLIKIQVNPLFSDIYTAQLPIMNKVSINLNSIAAQELLSLIYLFI